MLIARVDVSFGSDRDQSIEVMNIHMDEDPEQSSQYLLANRYKVFWKWNVLKQKKNEESRA